jgi:hypothetical protein
LEVSFQKITLVLNLFLSKVPAMRKARVWFLFFLFTSLASSCMTTRLAAQYDSDNVVSHKMTSWNFLWGLVQPADIAANCESKSICKVTSQTNLGYILVSALSLGIAVPQRVTWDCCPSVEKEEILR